MGLSEKLCVLTDRFRPNDGVSILTRACERQPEVLAQVKKHAGNKENRDFDLHFATFLEKRGFEIGNISNNDFSSLNWAHSDLGIEAYRIALAKYFRGVTDSSLTRRQMECFETAILWARRHFRPYVEGSQVMDFGRVFDYLPKDKSPGFIWKEYFKDKGELFQSHEALKLIYRKWEELKDPGCGATWWSALLKDELRLREKVILHKTRLFTAGSTEHAVCMDRLCLDFNLKFYTAALKSFSAVGMSPYKRGFDILRRKLRSRGFKNLEALDHSNYDGQIRAFLLWAVCKFRFDMLDINDRTPENWARLQNLYRDVIYSILILQDGSLVMKNHGMPSGVVNTVVDNTFINMIYLCFCWLFNGGPDDYDLFMEEVIAALFGDDNTYTYSDYAAPFVSGEAIARAMGSIGNEVTGVGLCTWDDVDFLSHSFVLRDGCFVPCLSFDRLVCGMLLGSSSDILESWMRASAFRAKAWPDQKSFDFFDSYMKHLLKLEPNLPMCYYASEDEIQELYLGCRCESKPLNKNEFERNATSKCGFVEGREAPTE